MTLRVALRTLIKQAVLHRRHPFMLALGIGSTTAIFSVVQGVLLKPLPFPDVDRMVEVWATLPARNIDQTSFTKRTSGTCATSTERSRSSARGTARASA
jgi:hypothetical protein